MKGIFIIFCGQFLTLSLAFGAGWFEPKMIFDDLLFTTATIAEGPELTVSEEEKLEIEPTDFHMNKKINWQPTVYASQDNALGWSNTAFKIPHGMEERVHFWVRIYTQLTTQQGLIHDSVHMSVVYDTVDFRPIESDASLSAKQIRKAKKKLIEDKKADIKNRLARLEKVKDASALTGEDLRLWNLFSAFDEKDKFSMAMTKKRLRFQLGQSDRFLQGIYYSGRYLKQMEQIFREKGLPIELTRLPFVESSFNIKARSRVGASGIWQFMRYTGRRFMRMNYAVDERNDPIRATEAAARLFRLNYEMLKDWPLAVTGYNHGPAGVQRVVKKFKTSNLADLVDERYGRFGFASANFYASFLAAIEVEKNAKKYFGDKVYWDEPQLGKEFRLTRPISKKVLERWFSDREQALEFNPHLSRSFWQGYASAGSKDFIRVPAAQYEKVLSDLNSLPTKSAKDERTIANEVQYYSIGIGETLSDIAQQMGVSVQLLKDLNDIENPKRIRAGQKIMIPTK